MPRIDAVKIVNVICNSTSHLECHAAYWIWRTVPFVLIAIGTLGNIVSLIVLARPAMRRYSTSVYLMFLAGSDVTVLYIVVLRETLYAITGERVADMSPFSCKTAWWFGYTAAGVSVWLLVLLTAERVMMVRNPVAFRHKLTQKTAVMCSLTLIVAVAVLNSHLIFGVQLYHRTPDFTNSTYFSTHTKGLIDSYPCYFTSIGYRRFFNGIWGAIILFVYNIVPIVAILIGNVIIARKLFKRNVVGTDPRSAHDISSTSQAQHLQQTRQQQPNGAQSKTKIASIENRRSFTRVLFVLSTFFIVTTLPYSIYNITKSQLKYASYTTVARLQLTQACVQCLMYSNFTLNFIFYFLSGKLFRRELKALILEVRHKFRLCRP